MDSERRRERRMRRRSRVRAKIIGSPDRPRLNVFRSNRHIYAQVVDDLSGTTLAAASSLEPQVRAAEGDNRQVAGQVGRLVAERARERGITRVVFDRAGYRYHGRVKALADGAREAGLDF